MVVSHGSSRRPWVALMLRISVCQVWWWVLTKPGRITRPLASTTSSISTVPAKLFSRSVPTALI